MLKNVFSLRQPAQIGVVAVLLTAVLLAIGISVTTQVVNQVQQETARQESGQSLSEAQSDLEGGGGTPLTGAAYQTASSVYSSVFLRQGDTVQISKIDSAEANNINGGSLCWDLKDNAADDHPALMVTVTRNDGTGSKTYILPIRAPGTTGVDSANWNVAGTDLSSGSSSLPGCDGYRYGIAVRGGNSIYSELDGLGLPQINSGLIQAEPGDTIRIKALYADTYVYMPHLTETRRAAATNDAGTESRVAEQNVSDAAPPYTADFTAFVAHGRICTGVTNDGGNGSNPTCGI